MLSCVILCCFNVMLCFILTVRLVMEENTKKIGRTSSRQFVAMLQLREREREREVEQLFSLVRRSTFASFLALFSGPGYEISETNLRRGASWFQQVVIESFQQSSYIQGFCRYAAANVSWWRPGQTTGQQRQQCRDFCCPRCSRVPTESLSYDSIL